MTIKSEIVRIALEEWNAWGNQEWDGKYVKHGLKERTEGRHQRVGDYWRTPLDRSLTGLSNQPWSAAFVSWLMYGAGVRAPAFTFSSAHSTYIKQAVQNRLDRLTAAPFVGWRPEEQALDVGDIVCMDRKEDNKEKDILVTYEKCLSLPEFASHGDVVVAIRPVQGKVLCIGGNVGNSVTLSVFEVSPTGTLTDRRKPFFAVIKNNLV